MAIPRAYQNDNSRHRVKGGEYQSSMQNFFWYLGLIIFLYGGLRLLDFLEKYENKPSIIEYVKSIQFPRNMAYAGQSGEKEGERSAEEAKQTEQKDDNTAEKEKKEEGEAPFFDPLGITSPNDVVVLKALGRRRDELDKREKLLRQKELEISILEKKVSEKVTALEEIEKKVKSQLNLLDEAEIEKAKTLAKLYGSMKPKDAASVFEGLDMAIVFAVASRMPEKKLAPIIAALSTDKARELTTKLSHKSTPLAKHLKEAATEKDKSNPMDVAESSKQAQQNSTPGKADQSTANQQSKETPAEKTTKAEPPTQQDKKNP